jgi:hypothetical protein
MLSDAMRERRRIIGAGVLGATTGLYFVAPYLVGVGGLPSLVYPLMYQCGGMFLCTGVVNDC